MFSKVIVSSFLLATLANGLAIRRDTNTSSVLSLPGMVPQPIGSLSDDPSVSLSLPPLDQNSTVNPTGTPLPSVVTTTVYVYPSQRSPTPSGSPPPTASPSGVPDSTINLPQNDSLTLPPPTQPTPIKLPDPEESSLNLPKVRRDDTDSVVFQLRALQQEVINTWVGLGKGDSMLYVVGQIETLVAQAVVPGADGAAILKQAQSLVNN